MATLSKGSSIAMTSTAGFIGGWVAHLLPHQRYLAKTWGVGRILRGVGQ